MLGSIILKLRNSSRSHKQNNILRLYSMRITQINMSSRLLYTKVLKTHFLVNIHKLIEHFGCKIEKYIRNIMMHF